MNLPTVGFCVGLCFLTSLVFGLLPALRFSRPVIISALKDDAGVGGRRVGRVQRVTAALQVAIAVPLIVMSGISLDRVRSTATADLGFAADLLYAVPLKVDGAKIANADFRIRSVRNISPGQTVLRRNSRGRPAAETSAVDDVRTALQPDAKRSAIARSLKNRTWRRSSFRLRSPMWITTI